MIPSSFRGLRALEHLNVAGVGLSLAAVTAAVFGADGDSHIAIVVGVPTLVLGAVWARLLRWPRTLTGTSVRVGWLLSIPLAAANAGIAAALFFGSQGPRIGFLQIVLVLCAGATMGVVVWGPALIATLVCFGLPIAWAQRSARKGLSGQERGELVVGAVCVLMALMALALSFVKPTPIDGRWLAGVSFTRAIAVAAMACASAAVAISASRARRRRAFVADVEAGRVERFRIDTTDEGKVLVRVVSQGEVYRVVDFEEEVAALDADGSVTLRRVGV